MARPVQDVESLGGKPADQSQLAGPGFGRKEADARRRLPAIGALGLLLALGACATLDDPTGLIEKKYAKDGPETPVTQIGSAGTWQCCDRRGNPYDLYYPAGLATGGRRPVVVWGNGTFGSSTEVAYFLRHLASWGFIVIATQDMFTGDGNTIADSAKFMLDADLTAGNMFQGKVDRSHIGAVGHSQGAAGVINAMINTYPMIITAIPIELPGQQFCSCPLSQALDTVHITQGSVFFVDGTNDVPISPPTQRKPVAQVGEESLAAFYAAVPASVPKVTASLFGPTHNDITGQPDCATAQVPCLIGVTGYLGYPTAWLADRLGLDAGAHAAFVMGSGEIFSQTSHWKFVQSNVP
jgi:hypothetical protein